MKPIRRNGTALPIEEGLFFASCFILTLFLFS